MDRADAPDPSGGGAVQVLVVAPDVEVIARAEATRSVLRELHPDWAIRLVWAGDPQLRPDRPGVATSRLSELELALVDPDARAIAAALSVIDRSAGSDTIVLVGGAVGVAGPLDALVPSPDHVLLVPRILDVESLGPGSPTLADLGVAGLFSTAAFAVGSRASTAVDWLRSALTSRSSLPVSLALSLLAETFPTLRCSDAGIGVSTWRWDTDAPSLVDATRFDPEQPWVLDPTLDGSPRVSLAEGRRGDVIASVADQLGAAARPLRLPGAIELDDRVRAVLREHAPDGLRPWSQPRAARTLVDRHYWTVLHDASADLRSAFPDGADSPDFATWARTAVAHHGVPLMVEPPPSSTRQTVARTAQRSDGVNLVGYFDHQTGVGEIVRRLADILERHGVPHTTVSFDRARGLAVDAPSTCDDRLEFATSIAVVNGDQVARLHHALPELFGAGRRVVGVWFWEIEDIDPARVGHEHVDEIWAATRFMATTFRTLGPVDVVHMPLPFVAPRPSGRTRADFGPIAGHDGRFLFGVVFDHMSITGRKNPIGAIRAFREAFEPSDGRLLLIKSINGRRCWRQHERVRQEAAGRDDIVVWDERLPLPDHMALIRSLDALVSLHRSEGLGLHLAEAMSLEIPVIATRYGGNVDFMDDSSSVLVDAAMVPIGSEGEWAYPPSAMWAEPDHAQAVAAMRRLAADPEAAAELGRRGAQHLLTWPSEHAFVDRLRARLHLGANG